jgi:predicted kinase
MEKKLILMQGVPGSGKSTLAKKIRDAYDGDGKAIIFSTDDYFYLASKGKEYQFDFRKLGEAHSWNHGRCDAAMSLEVDLVIIDNTNIKRRDVMGYVEMARKYGYTIEVVRSKTDWAYSPEECFKKNSHGVPLDVIERMLRQMEPIGDFSLT